MNILKYLSITANLFLLLGQLQVNANLEPLESVSHLMKKKKHHHATDCHKPCTSHHHDDRRNHSLDFLYAATPLAYTGQNVGTGHPNDTVAVNFPVIVDATINPPVVQISPGIFAVVKSGHYQINWEAVLQNSNSSSSFFKAVLEVNAVPTIPSGAITYPIDAMAPFVAPGFAVASGSIVVPLRQGDQVELQVINLSLSPLTTPVVITAAGISFIRIADF